MSPFLLVLLSACGDPGGGNDVGDAGGGVDSRSAAPDGHIQAADVVQSTDLALPPDLRPSPPDLPSPDGPPADVPPSADVPSSPDVPSSFDVPSLADVPSPPDAGQADVATTCPAGFRLDGDSDRCLACRSACEAGTYESSPCTTAGDRVCSSCAPIANCTTTSCKGPTDQVCTACASGRTWDGSACAPCSTCKPGESESAACTTEHDRACTACTVIPNCTMESCTTATDQVCSVCATGYFLKDNACVACSAPCQPGTFESAACAAGHDRTCSSCTALANCASVTCTSGTDQTCGACAAGFYASGGACVPCSAPCAAGTYESTACTTEHDRICTACTAIVACLSGLTCTTATDQTCATCAGGRFRNAIGRCPACTAIPDCETGLTCTNISNSQCPTCAAGTFRIDGTVDRCMACTTCAAGTYESTACGGVQDRVCTACDAIAGCTSGVTCTGAGDSQCTTCGAGTYLVEGAADTCAPCAAACAAGSYESTACTSATNRACTACTAVTGCTSALTCTGAADSQCTACGVGLNLVEGTADTCVGCTVPQEISNTTPGYASIVGYWTLNGTVGAVANGASIPAAIGVAGTAVNANGSGLAYAAGQLNEGLTFDGVDDRINFGAFAGADFGTADFSITFWFKTSRTGATQWLISKRAICNHSNFFDLGISSSNRLVAEVDQDGAGTNYGAMTGTTVVTDGQWHHVAYVRAGTSVRVYLDGLLEASATTAATTNLSNGNNFLLGHIACAGAQYFQGVMDDVAIWNGHALSQAEVQANACRR